MARMIPELRNNQQLRPFILTDVTATNRVLGTGSYGSVLEVKHGNLLCAAKKVHEILLEQGNEGVANIVQKYQQECQLMSALRHPNITQFLGLCFLPGTRLPLLVMERLETSLHDLLEYIPNLPISLKMAFLEGVCNGLDYLHSRRPAVVHRDLTASNVLLSSSLVAKISDLGNSRIVNMKPGQLAMTLSRLPGTLVYMPPEALSDSHPYGPSLDVFSFGHLALFTMTQVFPSNLLPATYTDPNNRNNLLARSEVARREAYMGRLEAQVGHSHPALVVLFRECLQNDPEGRPKSEELLDRVQAVRRKVDRVNGGNLLSHYASGVLIRIELKKKDKELEQSRMRAEEQLQEKDAEIAEQERQLQDKERQFAQSQRRAEEQLQEKDVEIAEQERQLQQKDTHLQQSQRRADEQLQEKDMEMERKLQQKDRQLQQSQRMGIEQLQQKEKQLEEKERQLEDKERQLEEKDGQLEEKKRHLDENNEEMRRLLRSKQSLEETLAHFQSGATSTPVQVPVASAKGRGHVEFPLEGKWRRGPDMPFAMSGHVQSATIQRTVYLGGGLAGIGKNNYVVMAYDISSNKWRQLPPYSISDFSMTVINEQLVLVGGVDDKGEKTTVLGVWDSVHRQWTHPYPPMPTAHSYSSAVVYKKWLIVTGGWSQKHVLSTVEVMDVTSKKWYSAISTPSPWSFMKSAVVEDEWYLMGGIIDGDLYTDKVYSVSLSALVLQATTKISTNTSQHMWKTISGLEHFWSAPLSIGDSLFAVGGTSSMDRECVSTIHHYLPGVGEWVRVGQLPHPLHACTSITISDKEVLVAGGKDDQSDFSAKVFIGNFV